MAIALVPGHSSRVAVSRVRNAADERYESRSAALASASAAEWRRASFLAAAGHRTAALTAARRACELAPEELRSWLDFGRVHSLLGDYDDAVACFAEAVTIDVRSAEAWHNLGTALHKLGKEANAFAALKNALLLDPARADTYLDLGNLLFDAGQVDDALECFERGNV